MSRIVLDASAILALLNAERGFDMLTPDLLADAACSTVNLAEVQSKLINQGADPDDAWQDALSPIREAVDFNSQQAQLAGGLVKHTRHLSLSLGDRACLALGLALDAPVYTTDQAWGKLRLNVRIHVIR